MTHAQPTSRRSFTAGMAALLAVAGLAAAAVDQRCNPVARPTSSPISQIESIDPDAYLTDALLDLQAAAGIADPRTPYSVQGTEPVH